MRPGGISFKEAAAGDGPGAAGGGGVIFADSRAFGLESNFEPWLPRGSCRGNLGVAHIGAAGAALAGTGSAVLLFHDVAGNAQDLVFGEGSPHGGHSSDAGGDGLNEIGLGFVG